ncbi:hypothetical protein CK486_16715 [Pseudomonas sp. HAR-UPW-AIA-41]|uniref:BPL-N domain-containing protein n=1 Tax=Pseudomonas sp. HAR-UPW-AIA-41 TaxID=1985301 RepID=UPI000BB2EA8F|nr:BPL-N domain-containing protein [Pseudomonas sp. HAR-UPW-AIA-41]PAV46784.1 hypothetical protein CK486_16715 [Pseudomonas sp. HAR-UPW-AIA-41]
MTRMAARLGSLLLGLLISGFLTASPAPAREPYALIYNGPTADQASTEAISSVVQQLGLTVRYIANLDDLPTQLGDARVFIIGGTDDDVEPLLQRFTPALRTTLKTYLSQGGRYLGICGGAYLASLGWPEEDRFVEGLALVPAQSDGYDQDFEAKIYPVTWLGETRQMYYQAGPSFALAESPESVTRLAYFEDRQLAALMSTFGAGKVAVSGPHPEAPDSWRAEALKGDQMDRNIDLALQLLRELLSDRPVK